MSDLIAHVRVWLARDGDWRWTATGHNGRVLADSGEGYRSKHYTIQMAQELFPESPVVVED